MENNANYQNEEVEIDLREIMFLLLDKLIVILLVGVLCAGLAFLGTKLLLTPKYQSVTSIYVMTKNEASTVSANDYVTSNYMTKDYQELITSRHVMQKVIADLNLDMTVSELVSMVTVENKDETRILYITITDTDAVRAMEIANAVRSASAERIKEVMSIEDVNLVDEADLNPVQVSPNVFKNMIIGGILGMVLTIAVVIIRHITDDTIKSPDEIEKYLGLSTLASIPIMAEAEWDGESSSGKKKKRSSAKSTKSSVKSSSKR